MLLPLSREQRSKQALMVGKDVINVEEDLLYEALDAVLWDGEGIDHGIYEDLIVHSESADNDTDRLPTSLTNSRSAT